MNGKYVIVPRLQYTQVLRDVDLFEYNRLFIGVLSRCVGRGAWSPHGRVAPGDFNSIEVSDISVIVLHPQRQSIQAARIIHAERYPHIGRRIDVVHIRFYIGMDQRHKALIPHFGLERIGASERLAGAQVRVSRGRRSLLNGGTGRHGHFNTRLAPGTYDVTVTKEGFNMARVNVVLHDRNVSRTVYLDRQPGRPPQGPGQPPPPQMLSLHVRVTVTSPRPPKQGRPGGFATTPAGGAAVSILQNGRPVASGKTGPGGNYTARLRPGAYQIKVAHGNLHGGQRVTLSNRNVSRTIALQSGAAVVPLTPRLPGNPTLQQRPLQVIPRTRRIESVQ